MIGHEIRRTRLIPQEILEENEQQALNTPSLFEQAAYICDCGWFCYRDDPNYKASDAIKKHWEENSPLKRFLD